uniref:flagellar basal body FlgE domain-containing protein n=2 Tax=Pseudomonadota TaxID=1224 RepID=UPI003B982473
TPANTWKVYTSLDTNAAAVGSLTFDASGKLTGNSTITGVQINSSNPNAPTPGTINGTAGVTLDFSNLSQFGSKFAV